MKFLFVKLLPVKEGIGTSWKRWCERTYRQTNCTYSYGYAAFHIVFLIVIYCFRQDCIQDEKTVITIMYPNFPKLVETYTTHSAVATLDDYVDIVTQAVRTIQQTPPTDFKSVTVFSKDSFGKTKYEPIMVVHDECILEPLKKVLSGTNISVDILRPPAYCWRDYLLLIEHENLSKHLCAYKSCGELIYSKRKLKWCSGCLQVKYCCKEHQKDDWKHHKLTCSKTPPRMTKMEEINNFTLDQDALQKTFLKSSKMKDFTAAGLYPENMPSTYLRFPLNTEVECRIGQGFKSGEKSINFRHYKIFLFISCFLNRQNCRTPLSSKQLAT